MYVKLPKYPLDKPSHQQLQPVQLYADVLGGLRKAYCEAISAVMICATVTVCVSILATLGMQRMNLNTITKEREVRMQRSQSTAINDTIEKDVRCFPWRTVVAAQGKNPLLSSRGRVRHGARIVHHTVTRA